MKNSKILVNQAISGIRPARTPIYDLLVNDAIIEYFSKEKLNFEDDLSTVKKAAALGMDATRSTRVPAVIGSKTIDAYGNTIENSRWTSWVVNHINKNEDDWVRFIKANLDEMESAEYPANEQKLKIKKDQLSLTDSMDDIVYLHSTPSTSINELLFGYAMGLEQFSYLWFDHKELIIRFLKAIEKINLIGIDANANPDTSPPCDHIF